MIGNSAFQNRWWIVFGSFLGLIVSQGAITAFSFSVFLKPVSEDLGVSRGTLSFAFNLYSITSAIAIPFVGFLIDRCGIRIVLLPMIVLFAVTTAGLSYLTPAPAVLYGLFAVQGIFAACQVPTGYAKAISGWFDRDRGLALGIAIAGVGLGIALMAPVMTYLIHDYGWRNAYIGLGAAVVVFAFIPVALFIKEPPSSNVPQHGAQPDEPAGLSLSEAVRSTGQFWAMSTAVFLVIMATNGTTAHVIAMLTDRGIPLETATAALSLAGLAITAGRIVSGYCVDRLFAPYVAVFFFSCPIIGISLLVSGASGPVPTVGTVLCGLGIGAEVDLMAFLAGRYFGLRAFGAIYGVMFAIFIAGAGLGTYLMGLSFDFAHSYSPALIGFVAALVVACVLIARLGPYRFAPTKTAPAAAAA